MSVDPSTGSATERLGADLHFHEMIAGVDDRYVYGLDDGRILAKLDAHSGAIIARRTLDDDVWFVASGRMAHHLSGQLNLAAGAP